MQRAAGSTGDEQLVEREHGNRRDVRRGRISSAALRTTGLARPAAVAVAIAATDAHALQRDGLVGRVQTGNANTRTGRAQDVALVEREPNHRRAEPAIASQTLRHVGADRLAERPAGH